MKRILEVAVLVALAFVTSGSDRVLAQDSEKSAVEGTVRSLEQAAQDYNLARVISLLTPDARWIENSLPAKAVDLEWPEFEKAKAAGVRITIRPYDFETHVQGDVAWVTLTLDETLAGHSLEAQKFLHLDAAGEVKATWVESEVLVKTPSGWKIALGHSSLLPKAQK